MKKNYALPLILMLAFALSRWPGLMPGNFSTAYAIVFCSGLYFAGWMGWVLPLATLFLSDILITKFGYPDIVFSWREFFINLGPNYIGYIALILLGRGLGKGKRSWVTLVSGGIIGAFVFYLVTNIASWITLPYPKTLLGLFQALTTGLPGFPHTWEFFRNTLMSGGLFSGLFVGAIKLLEPSESAEEKREPVPETEAEPEEAKS